MSEHRAAVIRVTADQMATFLALPEGNRVIRFQVVGTVLHCLVAGPAFAVVMPGEGGPLVVDIDTIRPVCEPPRAGRDRERKPRPAAG